jgi:protein O-mannosyl-transferase
VGAAALVLYLHTAGFGWVYDDQMEVVHNVLVRSLEHLPRFFTSTVWAGSGTETYLYRPLALVTYALNYQVSGLHPWSYHLVNILLHGGVSVLVFRLAMAWGIPLAVAGMGGLLFAVHPVHVEAVAAVFGRKDLLATGFTLLMVLGHLRARARGGWSLVLPPVAYGAALLSKEAGVAGLLLVAAHDLILERDGRSLLRSTRTAGLYVAYLAVLLLYLLVRAQVAGTGGVPETSIFDNPLAGADSFTRIATALVVVAKGIVLLSLPLTLSPDYSFNAIPLVESLLDPRLLLTTLLMGTLTVLGLVAWRRRPEEGRGPEERPWRATVTLLALAWYAVAVLPTSNLLVPTGTIFGERLLYLPSVAFCLLAAVALHLHRTRLTARVAPVGALLTLLVLASFSAQAFRYSSAWENDISLFRWATSSVPNSTKAHHKLGEELLREGNLGDGVRSLGRALDIAPGNQFAAVTMGMARREIAERFLPPPEGRGEAGTPSEDPDILYVLGQIRRDQGNLAAAEGYWREAVRADPRHAESLADLALISLLASDTVTALDHLNRAVAEKPSLAGAWYNLGRILLARGEVEEGRRALLRFLSEAGSRFPRETLWARRVLDGLGPR